MNLLSWFIVAHLVGDYLIQTEFEALNKALGKFWNRALGAHCLKYTLCFVPVLVLWHLSLFWLLLIFGSHLVLDRRWFVIWWRRVVTRNSTASIEATFWLTVIIDQIFHFLVVVVIAASAG